MNFRWLMIVSLLAVAPVGCLRPPPLDQAEPLPDTDNDGFGELETPEGVEASRNLGIELVNRVTKDELTSIIPSDALTLVAGLLNVTVQFDITLSYDTGDEVTRTETRELDIFQIRFEAACPDSITATTKVEASAPIVGTIFEQEFPPIVLTRDDEGGQGSFVCDKVVSFVSSTDEAGQPTASFTIRDF